MMWPFKTKTEEGEKVIEKEIIKYVDRVVVGSPIAIKIYEAMTRETEHLSYGGGSYVSQKTHGYFLSCEEAFKAFPGKEVKERDGLFIGGEYFIAPAAMNRVDITKPKIEKGKK